VRRGWPDRLLLRIEEQEEVAAWEEDALLNSDGDLFYPKQPEQFTADLIRLHGPRGTEKRVLQTWLSVRSYFQLLSLKVNRLTLNSRRAWLVELENGLRLNLGREETTGRVDRFARVYRKFVAPIVPRVAALDLRYTNGYAVSWREGQRPELKPAVVR
ncbi:MAG: cell division protein FtsQ/DivIB, partial [Gammaproteobacteria bacterium]|nr:cell division protein FtsQ/DivIB [Gammaproteobacteria bacterium]